MDYWLYDTARDASSRNTFHKWLKLSVVCMMDRTKTHEYE